MPNTSSISNHTAALLLGCILGLSHEASAASRTVQDKPGLVAAVAAAVAGDTIWVQGGTYRFDTTLVLKREQKGMAGRRICIFAKPGDKPVLDFSDEPYGAEGNPRGIQIDGDFWHLRGLTVTRAADNGIYVTGNDNTVENCVTSKNRDTGLQIGRKASSDGPELWPKRNLILNCESFDNYDLPPGSGENADGFACKLTAGEGNVFRGCVAHHNIDDGWDLYTKTETGPIGPVTLDRCIAYQNGTLTDGTENASGDRNGFKLGGEKIAVEHWVTRCVAFGNGKNGFTWNSNPGSVHVYNNLAFDNAEGNYLFGSSSVTTTADFANNLSLYLGGAEGKNDKTVGALLGSSNVWWASSKTPHGQNDRGLSVSENDFVTGLKNMSSMRLADGSPNFENFALKAGSKLLNQGVDLPGALPFAPREYFQGAPDLGPVELGAPTRVRVPRLTQRDLSVTVPSVRPHAGAFPSVRRGGGEASRFRDGLGRASGALRVRDGARR